MATAGKIIQDRVNLVIRRLWLFDFLGFFIRHIPDDIQIQGNRTTVPPPKELHPFRSHPMACFWRSALVWKAICPDFPPFSHTPPLDFTWPSIFPAYAGAGLRRRSSIRLRNFRNSSFGTGTSAIWYVTHRPCGRWLLSPASRTSGYG